YPPPLRQSRTLTDADQRRLRAPLAAADVFLELAAELLDRVLHRPASPVREAADRRARHDADAVADLFQNLEVFKPALAALDALANLQHPAGPFAARRALAARFV